MRQRNWDTVALSLYGVLALIFVLYGCGGTPGTSSSTASTSSGGDTTLTTTAKAPTSASASVGQALSSASSSSSVSTSKSVGKSEKPVVKVSKAAVADVAVTNGTAILSRSDGTEIKRVTPASNGAVTFQFNAADLNGQPPIVTIETIVNGKTVKLQNVYSKVPSAGDKIDLGETNAKISFAVAQAMKGLGLTGLGADLASQASLFTNSFQTFALNINGTASSAAASNGQDAMLNMANHFAECMASGSCDDPFDAFDSSQMKSFDPNFDTNSAKAIQFGSALANSYNSSSVLANLETAGDEYRDKCWDLIGGTDDYTGYVQNPNFMQNYILSNATEFTSKGASAVSDWGNAGFAKTFARLGEQCASGSCDVGTVDDYFEKMSASQFATMGSNPADFAKSYGKLFLQADTASERASMLANPNTYYNVCANGCAAMIGSGAATVAADTFNTVLAGRTDFGVSCLTNANCPTGQSCNLGGHFCESTTACTSNCTLGKVCASAGVCASGLTCQTFPGDSESRCLDGNIFTGGTLASFFSCSATGTDDFSDPLSIANTGGCWTFESRSTCLDGLTVANGQLTIDQKDVVNNALCVAQSEGGEPFLMKKIIPASRNFTIILSIASWSNLDTGGNSPDLVGLLISNLDDALDVYVRLDMRVINAGGDKRSCYVSGRTVGNPDVNTGNFADNGCNVGANYFGGMCLKLVRAGTSVVGSFKIGPNCSVDTEASPYTTIATVTNYSDLLGSSLALSTSDSDGDGDLSGIIYGITVAY